jgi:hypothetical protein
MSGWVKLLRCICGKGFWADNDNANAKCKCGRNKKDLKVEEIQIGRVA